LGQRRIQAGPSGVTRASVIGEQSLAVLVAGRLQSEVMATPGPFENILSRDDWLAILRCVGAEQERVDGAMGDLPPGHPRHAATEKARDDLATLHAKLHRLVDELGHAVT
jgi:hypothetical protein